MFTPTVSALSYSIIRARCGDASAPADDRHNRVTRYVLAQHAAMPDYLRLPFAALTVTFGVAAVAFTGRPFHALSHERRWRFVDSWRRMPVSFARDLIRFYESLVVFGWFTLESGGELVDRSADSGACHDGVHAAPENTGPKNSLTGPDAIRL